MMGSKNLAGTALFLAILSAPSAVVAESADAEGDTAYLVKGYRYEAAAPSDNPDTGHTLCGPRCNALSFDYVDYLMAGSWDIRKVAIDREIRVSLDNPFMHGDCICTVDEYLVKVNTRNQPKAATGN